MLSARPQRFRLNLRAIPVVLILTAGLQCGTDVPVFDGPRAYDDLVAQTRFGPRVPGTAAHASCADWLVTKLEELADTVWRQPFRGLIAYDQDSVAMTNIVARFRPDADTRILIGAHWDTRARADRDPDPSQWDNPVPGANDGASGVAVLLELARALNAVPPSVGVDLALFDGEDAGLYGETNGLWIQGSRWFAAHAPTRYRYAVVVDMVGDRDLNILREGHSLRVAPALVGRIWDIARRQGATAFQNYRGQDIIDDHVPFMMRGIPAVDIIDIDYAYWHTTSDTPDKCAPESLATVGQVLLELIYSE